MRGEHVGDDVGDVLAAVAVLRRLVAARVGQQRAGVAVDLHAVVVEVVLPRDLGTDRRQDAAERVADRGPPHAADVDRARRVGADELEVDLLSGVEVTGAVRRTGRDDLRGQGALGAGLDADVEEAGTGDLGARDAVGRAELVGEQLRELARVHAGLLGQLQRDVGGVVAVLLDLGALDEHLGRHPVGQRDRPRLAEGGEGTDDGRRELLGSHPPRLSALRMPPERGRPAGLRSPPESRSAVEWTTRRPAGRVAAVYSLPLAEPCG